MCVCACVFVFGYMCDLEYFMVKERVNSDRRQMWAHPWKTEDKKLLGQDLRIIAGQDISQVTYFQDVMSEKEAKHVNGAHTQI